MVTTNFLNENKIICNFIIKCHVMCHAVGRCRMSSGKTLWLCALHRDMTQATALNVASSSQPPLDDVERETGSAEMTLLSGLRRLREEGTEGEGRYTRGGVERGRGGRE